MRIERRDGSRVTGYVDRRSGAVFDWIEQHRPTSNNGPDDHDQDFGSNNRPNNSHGGNDDHGNDNNSGHGNQDNGPNRPGQNFGHDHDDD